MKPNKNKIRYGVITLVIALFMGTFSSAILWNQDANIFATNIDITKSKASELLTEAPDTLNIDDALSAVILTVENDIEPPESIEEGKQTALLCDKAIDNAVAEYRIQQMVSAAQSKAAANPGMFGILLVPSVGINVPLYYINASSGTAAMQAVVDAASSCAYIAGYIPGTALLADHSNQDFRALTSVRVGTTGFIVRADGVTNIVATTVMNGHNNGNIVDENMNPVGPIAPYVAYTCLNNSYNIRIVGFSVQ